MNGETPSDDEQPDTGTGDRALAIGQTLYTEAGDPVGTIRGIGDAGVFVTTRTGAERLTIEHARSGHEFGEGELMWRCTECGEMGQIKEGLPDRCPGCGEPKEALMYWTED